MRIGVTGHMDITVETARMVGEAIRQHLKQRAQSDGLVGVSCIGRGADSVFAEAVLSVGGSLEVVLPSRDYREAKVKPDHAEVFDALVARAAAVRVMDFDHASQDAYVAANEAVLRTVDELVAVWDGREDYGRGGTADAVADARGRGVPVVVIWPEGAERESRA
ncbi:hypothetical protein HNP84_004395 [Thermocatellispora tengchongensis]|uniref:DUF2493 domain-containing protein n=1 Tax=Thermocatellispora tengchongensis TaxID=1073253 RepID=A0A840P9X9_9ACTN|nr:hypothetical protein [Thermocatellispora tengchongensis]MBB5134661.1 hypothetical protein [Thermocatellispora tengchongensis]